MTDIKSIAWDQIKIISFDLDDTLWDNRGVIETCQQALFDYLSEQHPPIKERFSIDAMESIAQQLQLSNQNFDNMTLLRKAVIKQMLIDTDGDLALINPAFAIFYHWRNQIQVPKISRQVLQTLTKKYTLVATSNGNSNLHQVGLAKYFDQHLIAGIHGQAKPSPEMLNYLVAHYQINTNQLVHIGDSFETDILSAKAAKVPHLELNFEQIGVLHSI
ncbi:HAD-IA family hydrolase [Kangiella sp. TOML190]|uniref:HAD-IA family hydrolase n=1 Tax=Kangiella sp. TOML190 TaxID=2931351 RepID=UPI00203D0CAA|nr:HAD-IA family hydrolase [Kangiella sp. TOML190]